jgi:hypothetical protein
LEQLLLLQPQQLRICCMPKHDRLARRTPSLPCIDRCLVSCRLVLLLSSEVPLQQQQSSWVCRHQQ